MYYAKGVEYKEDSKINRKIKELFLDREVRGCITTLVEYVFDTATDLNGPPFTMDDMESGKIPECPCCGSHALENVTVSADEITPLLDETATPDLRYVCPICLAGFEDPEDAKSCCAGLEVYQCMNCEEIISIDRYEEMTEGDKGTVRDWFLVTPWMRDRLQECGEVTIHTPPLWGAQVDGKHLVDEFAVNMICRDIQILQGQDHDWSLNFEK